MCYFAILQKVSKRQIYNFLCIFLFTNFSMHSLMLHKTFRNTCPQNPIEGLSFTFQSVLYTLQVKPPIFHLFVLDI